MKLPEHAVLRRIVQDWLHKADLDLRAAETLLAQNPPLLYPSCFHAQQAAEKYLKAFLTSRQVEFPKTHDIREILRLAATADQALVANLQAAATLTPYAVEARYPGQAPDPCRAEADQALDLARKVRDAVIYRLREI